MRAMINRDTAEASALFASRVDEERLQTELGEQLDSVNYVLFDGYEGVNVLNVSIGPAFSTNPDAPQGTVARANGVVVYAGGYRGSFQAVLEREGDEWKIHSINVTAPPEKFDEYLRANP